MEKGIYIIMDMEWTCWGNGEKIPDIQLREVLAVGAIKVDDEFNLIDTFYRNVKPVINPKISKYCKNLTGLSQKDVDSAKGFCDVFLELEKWIDESSDIQCIYFWGDKDELVLKEQAKAMNYEGKIIDWANNGKINDIQKIILEDINKKLNIDVRISLKGAKILYGIKSKVTHNPLDDSNDVRNLWRVKNIDKVSFDESLAECSRHMYTLSQLTTRVFFIEKNTAWLSNSKDINNLKLKILYKFLSDVKSDSIITEGYNGYNQELENYECNFNIIIGKSYKASTKSSTLKCSMDLLNITDTLPIGYISNKGLARFGENANIIENGLIGKIITADENTINITYGKMLYRDKAQRIKQPRMFLIVNSVIILIDNYSKNRKAYNEFSRNMSKYCSTPYPLQG